MEPDASVVKTCMIGSLKEPRVARNILRAGASRVGQVRPRATVLPRLIARRLVAILVAISSSSKTRVAIVVTPDGERERRIAKDSD